MTDTTDRELLEMAKKAIGYEGLRLEIGRRLWNPLKHGADALGLAVTLRITFHFEDQLGSEHVEAKHSYDEETGRCGCVLLPLGADAYAATRRAIVQAAAEIGKAMP